MGQLAREWERRQFDEGIALLDSFLSILAIWISAVTTLVKYRVEGRKCIGKRKNEFAQSHDCKTDAIECDKV